MTSPNGPIGGQKLNWLTNQEVITEIIKNKAKSIGAQLSVNVVAAAVIDTDADVDTDDATDSTVADFAFAATFATFTNFAKFPSFATLVTFDTFATFVSFADGDHDVLSHLH